MTVRSKDDLRRWQTVFDREAPLAWVWENEADAATVTWREVRATGEGGSVVTKYGATESVEVSRDSSAALRGSCATPAWLFQKPDALFEVSLVQKRRAVELARATERLVYAPASITVRTKASRDWRRVVEPRTSGFDAAWWGLAGSSGHEVLWSNRKGTQTVTREFPAAGTVDTANLSFGTAGLAISVR